MITSPSTGVDTKAWDFLTHYHDTQAWLPRNIVFVNKEAFDKLTADQKKALTDAAKAAEERGWKASSSRRRRQRRRSWRTTRSTVVAADAEALKKGFAGDRRDDGQRNGKPLPARTARPLLATYRK